VWALSFTTFHHGVPRRAGDKTQLAALLLAAESAGPCWFARGLPSPWICSSLVGGCGALVGLLAAAQRLERDFPTADGSLGLWLGLPGQASDCSAANSETLDSIATFPLLASTF